MEVGTANSNEIAYRVLADQNKKYEYRSIVRLSTPSQQPGVIYNGFDMEYES